MKKFIIILAILFFTAFFGGSVKAQNTGDSDKSDAKIQKSDYDQNVVIKRKPQPIVSRSCSRFEGRTRVRATFDKSGEVTDVELLVSSGCDGFDENAIKAAKKIKFKPALKNGEPVTITKQIEYAFYLGR